MGLEADAIAVAAGELDVVGTADALELVEERRGRPVPLASHRSGGWCVTFFLIKQTDGHWRDESVLVRDGEVRGSTGGTGGILRRSEVEPGQPHLGGIGGHFPDDDWCVVYADGVSADDAVTLVCEGKVVAEAAVAAHGHFVLCAVLPADAEVTVGPGETGG